MQINTALDITGIQCSVEEIITQILTSRGIKDVDTFLHPPHPETISPSDFGYEEEIKTLCTLLEDMYETKKTVIVYTDYDADGITGGAVMWETLHLLGFHVMPYVPHRKHEGYGFSIKGIDTIKKIYDPALIISVDHGITAVQQIAYAASLGINVVVTDHHHKQSHTPDHAKAIIHIPELSGSGVAYIVAKAVFLFFVKKFSKQQVSSSFQSNCAKLESYFKADFLALAAIGIVADLVPLVGASRSIVYHGLKAFNDITKWGIRELCREAQIDMSRITPYEIGFIIAPRINAVGRLEHAIDALRLLCTNDRERARTLASRVGGLNTDRQNLVKESVLEAIELVEKLRVGGNLPKLIILHSPKWNEGIIGLIASNLLEKYYRPIIVMTEGDGQFKGSARSIKSFHITKFFESLKDFFINFGGHAQAAGFTIARDQIQTWMSVASKQAELLISDEDLEREIDADMAIDLHTLTMDLARKIDTCAPFGIGNPKPVFTSTCELINASVMGKNKEHLKMTVKEIDGSATLEIVAFKKAELFKQLQRETMLEIVYQLDINTWNGTDKLQAKLIAINI